ncbi:aspartate/glutamate racemase family protein [Vreelandella utahensis]|uniref:aspartate/glutamate racemase family protein n=1 Tax=Vreelandella halophila TaxID=86177 RepID=UPI0009875124|nr:aspartate/glutamate racemase family protein [Halomonas utahensis]
MSELVENLKAGSANSQAQIYLELTNRLKAAGADVVALASVAGHFCENEFSEISPLPIVSMVGEVDRYLAERGFERVGILGNKVTMETRLFGGVSAAELVVPEGEDLELVNELYMNMATRGEATEFESDSLIKVGARLCSEQGAQAVLLAGTDLFLAFGDGNCGYKVVDSGLVHIDELVRQIR